MHLHHKKVTAESWTYSAEFTGADEDSALIQHASIQVEHVVDVNSHKILCQVPLQEWSTRGKSYSES